ncbi:MAG TPA: ABC transporter permease [Acidimicrobiales bacterium]|jgi:ABC-2 type transport system permease protein|nr:ABC transporter permease [Acidimicrobiales bacterium]
MSRRALAAQFAAEVRMTLERGESLLVTFGIPIGLLVFFSEVPVLPTGTARRIDFLAPGVLSLAVMSTAMVSLGIATGFERSYGVLKRLGATPLGRRRLLAAKIAAVLAVECVQVLVIGGIAAGLGWRPPSSTGLGVLAALVATVAFGGIGLLLAGTLRAEVNLAVVNGLYVLLLLLGGIVFPLDRLGGGAPVARALPAGALSEVLHGTLGAGGGAPAGAWAALGAWAVLAPALAAATFRFE